MSDSLQSTVQCLLSTLGSRSSHRGSQAAQLASDLYTLCVESVSDTELAHCSSVLFNRESGILYFLRESASLDEFASCQVQLLNLLESYVRTHKPNVLQYAVEIKEVCNSLFSRNKSSKVKNAVFPPLVSILELVVHSSLVDFLNLPKLAEKYFQATLQPTKHVATVRGNMFQLLGTLCELYPEVMNRYADRLVDIFTRTLNAEMCMAKRKPDMPVIAGCLRGVTSYLINFSQSVGEGSAHSQAIYKFARMAMDTSISLTRYEVPRASLSLIASQASQFRGYFAKDYEHMYKAITTWTAHSNRENRNIALRALEAFLQQMSLYVVENASKDRATNLDIFKYFVVQFREVLSNKSCGYLELALAVTGYGYFAAPCKIFMKPEDLVYMFGEMVQRTEQIFLSPVEVIDSRFANLPFFLTALASIVKEMDDISGSLVLSLEKLLVLLFKWLPSLSPTTSKLSHQVVLKLILAVASSSRATLKTFLSHIILQGVINSCSHEPVIDTGEEKAVLHIEGDTDILGHKKASYLDYVELWRSLIDPTRLKITSLFHWVDLAERKTLHQLICDEFVGAILKLSRRLDLSFRSSLPEHPGEFPLPVAEKDSSPSENADNSGVPQLAVPKDHIVFMNLVDLCRAILLKVESRLLEEWVFPFGHEMIVLSSHHPTVSGFYKLLAVCFQLCKNINYFKDIDVSTWGRNDKVAMDTSGSAMDTSGSAMETDATDRRVCFVLFRKFTKEVLVCMRQYKDDLLASCLQLLLSLPKQLVELEIEDLVPALQISFKLGLSYLPLAHAGLDALEAWSKYLPPDLLRPHFHLILPYLDDYLCILTSEQRTSVDRAKNMDTMSKSHTLRGRRMKIAEKWKEGVASAESPLDVLRHRIIFFLGSLGGQVNGSLVEGGLAPCKVVAWDSKNRLEFFLPFQDMKPSLFLDSFLPRVCELATSSSVRQTKIAACELLHALVLFIIGKSAQPAHQKKSPMTRIYKKLFPYLLQLGCDIERVAEQLFRPLVFQMIHWFTRNTQYESPDTIALLDAILSLSPTCSANFKPGIPLTQKLQRLELDHLNALAMVRVECRSVLVQRWKLMVIKQQLQEGVVHSTDSALRDFCASCVKEFLEWSIKQTTEMQQEKSPINTKSLLKRIYSLAVHPSAAKRMGAALAINTIYTIFREESSLVDMFVIEMLVTMISSLRLAHADSEFLGTQEQICQAIGHIARVICVKAPILCVSNKQRRIPKTLKSADMKSLIGWLLAQCGSSETACRVKCRELFSLFAAHLPKVTSARVWIRRTLESEGGCYFVSRFENNRGRGGIQKTPILSGTCFSLTETVVWLERLAAALDSYNWVLADELLLADELFLAKPNKSEKASCLFQSAGFFMSTMALQGIEGASGCFDGPPEPPILSPREWEWYSRIKCNVILHLLKFVGMLVDHLFDSHASCVPSEFWSDDLFRLLATCCTQPAVIGFSRSDIKTTEKLSIIILSTFGSISKSSSERTKSSLLTALASVMNAGSTCDLIGQLPLCLHGDGDSLMDQVQLGSLVSAHLVLLRADLLMPLLQMMGCSNADVIPKLLASVVDSIKPLVSSSPSSSSSTQRTRLVENQLSPGNEQNLRLLFELALEMGVTPPVILDCLLDLNSDSPGLGLLLYHSFSSLLNHHFSFCHEHFLSHLLDNSSRKPHHVSAILCAFLEHVHKEKALRCKIGRATCSYLVCHWSALGSWWSGEFEADQRQAAISILRKLFALDHEFLVRDSADSARIEPVFSMYLTLLEEPQSSLTFKAGVLELLHHFASLPDSYVLRLKGKINGMVAKHFPLKSKEFPSGTPQYNEYISCLEKLLMAMVLSGSLALLEVVLGLICREDKHVHEDHIQSSLLQFLERLPPGVAKSSLDVAYKVVMDDNGHSPETRRAAGERVCVTFLRSCDLETLRDFFLDHVCEIMEVLEAHLTMSKVDSQLTCKLCCFQMMEVLYSRLPAGPLTKPEGSIVKSYCKGMSKTGKELTQAITRSSHLAKSEDLHGDRMHYVLRRQFHCAAYNALMAVIMCTQTKPQFYHGFLFKEDVSKGQLLWENLVDLETTYRFDVELERPLSLKGQMTAIRDEIHAQSSGESSPIDSPTTFAPHYLSSQYLADSSLCVDMSHYDFSTGIQTYPQLLAAPAQKESSYMVSEEQMEMDVLNEHECMLPLLKLLDHMQHNNLNCQGTVGHILEMPSWMAALHKSFNDGRTHKNIRLFIARLIVNRCQVFQPYARFWLGPLAQLVVGGESGGVGLHYFVVDVMVTILSWSTTAVLEDSNLSNRLLGYLMRHCPHHNKSVLRNNLEIIKTLVESWKVKLRPSYKVIFDLFSGSTPDSKASQAGIQLLGIMLANGMPPYDQLTAEGVDEPRFYSALIALMSHKYKDVFAATAEVLGLALAFMESNHEESLGKVNDLVIHRLMELASSRQEDKFLTCLHKIQLNYDKLTGRFMEKLLFLLPNFHGVFRSMCLEVLLPLADIQLQLYVGLKDKGFHSMLTHRDVPTQLAALKLVRGMVLHRTLAHDQLCCLMSLVIKFSMHSSEDCRMMMYDLLIIAYGNIMEKEKEGENIAEETSLKDLLGGVRSQLLEGLSDDSETIRLKMFAFWNEESRLSSDTLPRLTQLLPVLYSPSSEYHFLHYSTNLLLELTSRSPDFNRSIFDSPLSECKFEECTDIDLSWHQRHLQMTPLFAATQASQSLALEQSVRGDGVGVALRATQRGLAFTPTQEGYSWMAPSLQAVDSSHGSMEGSMEFTGGVSVTSSLLFKVPSKRPRQLPVGPNFGKDTLRPDNRSVVDPQEEQRNEILKLKRRFVKDPKITSFYFAKVGARKKIMREERRQQQRAARDSRVVMYRKYRKGELPDIQINHSELIRSFQALAQHDSTLARMLFTLLYEAIFQQVDKVLTEKMAEETTSAIKEAFSTIMDSSTVYHPPFIGSLQEICYREKQLELKPELVTRASLMSMQEPIGIMLLEKQLLCNLGNLQQPGLTSKKARTSSAPLPEATAMWVELSRLYKSLGNYDAVRGIFSSQVGTKSTTREALEAEERGDFLDALHQYKEAMKCEAWKDGAPTPVEEDLWGDSLLACYSQLTEWEELEKAAIINVVDLEAGETLDMIWNDPYNMEHYLPHIVHSKVKLACSGKDDPNFAKFLERALKTDSKQRLLLESEHSMDLAIYSVLKGNLDGARYYINITLQYFLSDWSNMDKLLVNSRASRLHVLQSLAELQEYIEFVSDSRNFDSTMEVESLLEKWRGRCPHPKRDPVSVWDDMVTSRCMMMNKIMDAYSTHPRSYTTDSLDDSQDGVAATDYLASLQHIFSLEFTRLYLKLADSARLQNNYALAYKSLRLTESAIAKHFPSDIELQLEWMHSVAKIRWQEADQDPSPAKISPLIALVERFDGYADASVLATNHDLALRHHLLEGSSYTLLARAFSEDSLVLMDCMTDDCRRQLHTVMKVDPLATVNPNQIAHKLLLRGMASLKGAVKCGTEEHKRSGEKGGMVAAMLEMATFCDRELRIKEDEDVDSLMDVSQYPSVVVSCCLKAMRHGSRAATQQFPRLLQLLELHPDTLYHFKKKSADVPCWMFIGWISQMVALLDKPEGVAIHSILLSIATDYPQALCYPLKISSRDYKFDSSPLSQEQRNFVEKLKSKVVRSVVNCFMAALELLSPPELVVKDFLYNELHPLMDMSVVKRDKLKVDRIWMQLSNQLQEWQEGSSSSLYGEESPNIEIGHFHKKFAKDHIRIIDEKFGRRGSKLGNMPLKEFKVAMDDLVMKLKQNPGKKPGMTLLKDFSPWLSGFHAYQYTETVEIPGQYDGKSKPLPEYHVKISGFDEKVLVISSMRKPKCITIRGDDEKEYMFLVKGGEDLRLDQRIEQLYCAMNDVLQDDAACSQRGLCLRTYQVIPMTPRVGIIEWMKNTKPLKEFVMDALREDEVDNYKSATMYHKKWLTSKYKNSYQEMYRNARRSEVETQYRKKVACIPSDIMRRAFLQLSSCPEAFLTLRTHCIRTLATLSVCQYVLGIGDRHLSNFMVDLESGGMIGIDFGHNFGTATQFLPILELMPFRLTPQFVNLLLPHVESPYSGSGQMRSCMVHALRALRNSRELLLNMMDVFVKEPALDWKTFARKQAKSQRKTNQAFIEDDGSWYPWEKILTAKKKLMGYNSSHIMLVDLRNGHGKTQEFPKLKAILMGDKMINKRAQVSERCSCVEEQVSCLVDHATDPNILGRTYAGWEPWV